MPIPIHAIEFADGGAPSLSDKAVAAVLVGVANAAGGGAGAAVTTAVSFGSQLPPNYTVHVTPSQPAMVSVTGKTSTGFNVVLTPLATVTLSAGTFDVIVLG